MQRYEVLFLTVPEITADEAKTVETKLEDLIRLMPGSSVISFERWGKYRLAYPIRNNDYGIYFLVRFEVGELPKGRLIADEIRTFFAVKYGDIVMRHMISALDKKQGLEYQRPESLEDVPTRDVDTFLKENKMSGLISKSAEKAEKAQSVSKE
ncbi:30S ribosomal protein S6 [Candidatus Dependentiae bacterium]|nr:30S ribosomal protein S6 [Candidatus Dependentiae bacterium]